MAENSGKQRVMVTGHNRESSGRVVHYLRPIGGSDGGQIEFHGGLIVSDEKNIIPDGQEFDVKLTFTPAK